MTVYGFNDKETPLELRRLLNNRNRSDQRSLSIDRNPNTPIRTDKPIKFLNASGETIPPYACMFIDGAEVVDQGNNKLVYYKAVKPSTSKQFFPIFNGPNEIADDGTGTAQTGRIQKMLYDTLPTTPIVGAIDGEWYVGTDSPFPRFTFIDDWRDNACLADIEPQTVLQGKTAETIAANAAGDVTVYYDSLTTNFDIEDVNLDQPNGGEQISADKWVWIKWFQGENRWRISHAECEDDDGAAAFQVEPTFSTIRSTAFPVGRTKKIGIAEDNKVSYFTDDAGSNWNQISMFTVVELVKDFGNLSNPMQFQTVLIGELCEIRMHAGGGVWVTLVANTDAGIFATDFSSDFL